MRARLATADPAANDDALVQHTTPSRRRPRRRLWCALGAAVLLDLVQRAFTGRTSNMRLVLRSANGSP